MSNSPALDRAHEIMEHLATEEHHTDGSPTLVMDEGAPVGLTVAPTPIPGYVEIQMIVNRDTRLPWEIALAVGVVQNWMVDPMASDEELAAALMAAAASNEEALAGGLSE